MLATLEPRWSELFQAVACGEDVERKKPSPEVYRKIVDLLGLPAHQCLAVEDSRNGLLAAQGAGIPVLITRSFYFADDDVAGALAVVANLAALEKSIVTRPCLTVPGREQIRESEYLTNLRHF